MVFFILASDLRDFKPDESFSLFMLGLSQFGWAEGKSKNWEDQNIKSGDAASQRSFEILTQNYPAWNIALTLGGKWPCVIFKVSWSDQFGKWAAKLN